MDTTKLSSKGQIVLPKSLREAHGWVAGQEFLIRETSGGLLLIPARPFPPTTVDEAFGCAGYSGPVKSLEEMNEGIARGARQRG